MSLLQNEDFKTEAQITGAGGSASQLLNDTKIWVTGNSINKTLDDAIIDGDIGGGGSGINYITNGDFKSNDTGWVEYADAAGVAPVDGTGGAPVTAFTRSTSSPLRGTGSGFWNKIGSVTRQGEGVAYAFTLDTADQGKIQQISFDYTVTSSYADGDMRVYIYDITNSVLIEPSQRDILANSGQGKYLGYFQAPSNSTSYRFIIHTSSASTANYDLKIDNVKVGPANGAAQSKTIAFRMVKNSVQAIATTAFTKITFTSVASADTGLDFSNGGADTTNSRFVAPESGIYSFTTCLDTSATDDGTGVLGGFYKNGALYYRSDTAPGTGSSNQLVMACLMNLTKGDYVEVYTATKGGDASYLVVGHVGFDEKSYFEGFLIKSTDANASSNSAISMRASAGTTNFTGSTTLVFSTKETDTSGAYNSSTGEYTIPESGFYAANALIRVNAITLSTTQAISVLLYRNSTELGGNTQYGNGSSISYRVNASVSFYANKGDVITAKGSSSVSSTMNGGSTDNFFTITKINNPAQIPPTEFVGCSYQTNAAQSISNNTETTILFEDILFDTHSAMNTGTGIYTIPISGIYQIDTNTLFDLNAGWGATEASQISIYKNGNAVAIHYNRVQAAATTYMENQITHTASFVKGDQIMIAIWQNSGGSISLISNSSYNQISIKKLN